MLLRSVGLRLICALGTNVVDQRTGERLGRVFFFGWRGRLIAIGLSNEPPVRPFFLPQERLTYWKQEIGLKSDPLPDFPSTANALHDDTSSPAEPPAAR
ncbi:MAG: hypothetical protein V4710_03900 [Verrucomicrobiota bacterium]